MTIRENLETAALKSAVSTNTDLQAPNGRAARSADCARQSGTRWNVTLAHLWVS
jgi:hypothetical protein